MRVYINTSIGQLQYLDRIGNDIEKHCSTVGAMGRIEHKKQDVQTE